ncbi:hypothetical protein MVEN_00256800 [Mycena venus]|uniref:F-box domain-containing protein n=1 Tax=Mycena venus TaxID=2733690 RepID=A0A8H6Z4T6_9AGAR|nr:hypothetical protein MVEN_00256800 [Mycena venus]
MPSIPDPAFPLELEQEIFTTAALMRSPHFFALRTAYWFGSSPCSKSLAFRHDNIRNVFWWNLYRGERMLALLSTCTGVQNLALRWLVPSMLPYLRKLQLRRLTLSQGSYYEPEGHFTVTQLSQTEPFFATLTHLHIHHVYGGYSTFDFQWLAGLPSLTHLCIENVGDNRRLLEFLQGCERLQVLVLCAFTWSMPTLDAGPWKDDWRVVILRLDVDNRDHHIRDWKLGAAGGRDFWVRAEEFLAKKLNDKNITTQFCDQ